MRFRLWVAVLALCTCLAAQTTLTVDQMVSFIRSSIQLKQQDREVAAYVRKLKMSERLEDRVIEMLQGEGAGAKTVEALHELRDASASLPAAHVKPPAPKPVPIPPPSAEEQGAILSEVRENALNYSKTLPDFICTQVTRRYADPSGMEFWQAQDTLTTRLSYFEQKEDYKLVLVNSRPVNMSYHDLGGATSAGEFGSMLREIFEQGSETRFEWERWATLRRRRAYVFSFRVPQSTSKYRIDYQRQMQIVSGYHGLIFVDRDTKMVQKITLEADTIPPSFPVQQASTVLDYDFIKIGDRDFMLPLRAELRMRSGKFLSKNDTEFRMYRKFSAEATVTFDTPAPLNEEQIKEQPPK